MQELDATAQISQVLPNICGKCWLLVVGNAQMHRWGAEGSLINLTISRFAQAMDGQLRSYLYHWQEPKKLKWSEAKSYLHLF